MRRFRGPDLRTPGVRVAAAIVVATLAGAGIGTALGREPAAQRADPGQLRIGLRSGVARLPLPAGWVPLDRHSSLPGLHDATDVQGLYTTVALDLRPAEDPSLLPAAVRRASGGKLPEPRLQRLGARTAWRYEIPRTRTRTGLVALVLPTTGGVVTIACDGDSASTVEARDDCREAMSALRLEGASELAPAPETAARTVLPGIVARLNAARESGRRALGATRSPGRRDEAARRLSAAYHDAAERLRPLAAGAAGRLTVAFAELARRHLELAAASRRREAVAAQRAGTRIEHGERRLQRLFAALGPSPPASSAGLP